MAKIKIHSRYGVIPNELLNNKEVTFKAKGLYAYIQSKSEDWDFSCEKIAIQSRESIDAIKTGIKELESIGYLKRIKIHNEKGYFDTEYILYEKPMKDIPILENPTVDFPSLDNGTNNSNKDLSNKDLSNKEIEEEISKEILNARILALEKENQELKEKKEKEKSSAKKEKEVKFDFKQALINEGVDEVIAADFMLVRKEKKAPSTETAFKLILNECERNQFSINEAIKTCINKNWQSFKYEWYVNLNGNARNSNTPETKKPSDNPISAAFGLDNNRQEGKPMFRFVNPTKVPSYGYVGQEQEV